MSRRNRGIVSSFGARRLGQKGSPKHTAGRWWKYAVVAASCIVLSVRLFELISNYAVNVFFSDQWDFNDAPLFQEHSLWEMFRWQHGPHRQGLGAVLAHFVEPRFGWNSRSEAFFVGILVVTATLCALWLKARLFGAISFFDVCIPLLFLNPLQFETLFMTANLAHGPLPLLLLLLYCLAWTIRRLPVRYGLVLLINFLTIYTGFGLFLGVITPIAVAADYFLELKDVPAGKAYLFVSLLVSLASLGSFFIHYIFQTAADCSPNFLRDPWSYLQFTFLIFANLLGVQGVDLFPLIIGAIVVATMGAGLALSLRGLWTQGKTGSAHWAAAILITYSLLFNLNAAYGRSCLGLIAAQASRYVIYGDMGLLGLYFFFLTVRKSDRQRSLLFVLTGALVATIPIRQHDASTMGYYASGKAAWRSCYLSLEDIQQCDQFTHFQVYPRPERNDLKHKLEFLKRTKQNLYSDLP